MANFTWEPLSSVTLHVPVSSLDAYIDSWGYRDYFKEIVAIGEGDGIEHLTSEEEKVAFKSMAVYDLSGHRVSKPRKGIYVINGRKTVVK